MSHYSKRSAGNTLFQHFAGWRKWVTQCSNTQHVLIWCFCRPKNTPFRKMGCRRNGQTYKKLMFSLAFARQGHSQDIHNQQNAKGCDELWPEAPKPEWQRQGGPEGTGETGTQRPQNAKEFHYVTCNDNVKMAYWNGHITKWFITCHHFEIPFLIWDLKNC